MKYTDKWAERQGEAGTREQWGDKWEERFKDGRGTKQVGWRARGPGPCWIPRGGGWGLLAGASDGHP